MYKINKREIKCLHEFFFELPCFLAVFAFTHYSIFMCGLDLIKCMRVTKKNKQIRKKYQEEM